MKKLSTRERVRKIFREYPDVVASNPNLLLSIFWEQEGVANLKEIKNATTATSIMRAKSYILNNETEFK